MKFNNLIFSDEFTKPQLDLNKWNVIHLGNGFGNKEWQFYRSDSDNVRIENNQLVIVAKKEIYEHRYFTSAKITTDHKFSFKYGRVDIVAKLPKGLGMWPAFWMMPENSNYGYWPNCGEIDIMESLGHFPNKIYGTIHYGRPHTYHGPTVIIENPEEFHKYSVVWEENKISWYVDDKCYGEEVNWFSKNENKFDYPAPFNQEFYLIINLAVGGNFSGYPDKTTIFPQKLIVDSVKVYN